MAKNNSNVIIWFQLFWLESTLGVYVFEESNTEKNDHGRLKSEIEILVSRDKASRKLLECNRTRWVLRCFRATFSSSHVHRQ